jgi:phage tail-like protein
MSQKGPYIQFRFRVEIDGVTQAGFSECSLLDSTTDPVDYREVKEAFGVRKLSGLTKYGNITLKRGVSDSADFYKWRRQVTNSGADGARRNMSIILIDEAGEDVARWDIFRAWPTKCDPPDFSAKGNEVAIETLEIVHEGLKRVS